MRRWRGGSLKNLHRLEAEPPVECSTTEPFLSMKGGDACESRRLPLPCGMLVHAVYLAWDDYKSSQGKHGFELLLTNHGRNLHLRDCGIDDAQPVGLEEFHDAEAGDEEGEEAPEEIAARVLAGTARAPRQGRRAEQDARTGAAAAAHRSRAPR